VSGVQPTSDIAVRASLFEAVFTLGGDVLVRGGVKSSFSETGSPLKIEPIGLAVHLEAPSAGVDMRHMFALSLENSAGIPVPWSRRWPTASDGLRFLLEAAVDVFGPVPPGRATLGVPWCANLHNVKVPDPRRYRLVLSVDNADARRLDFDVVDMNR
jgi:hypothetical protein